MHPRQPPLEPDLETTWLAALNDAGVLEDHAILVALPGDEAPDGCAAKCWPPVIGLGADEVPDEVRPWLDDLNRDDIRKGHRVALWTHRSVEGRAALLRHELEHGHQLAEHGMDLSGLHDLAEAILGGVPESGRLYQEMPMEADANAAASLFVRERFGHQRIDELVSAGHPDSAALRPGGLPGPLDTLMDRMIDFFVVHADLCMSFARATDMNFAGLLGIHSRAGRRSWCDRTGLDGKPS
jgi:hypothetical protein